MTESVRRSIVYHGLLALVFVSVLHSPVSRAESGGESSTDPMQMSAIEAPLQLRGQATLRVMFWRIYDSALMTPNGDWWPGIRPLRLEIRYRRAIRADRLVEQTEKEWSAQGIDHPRKAAWLSELGSLWPDVQPGDALNFEVTTQERGIFTLNGEILGAIDDPDFSSAFLAIWLSPDTTQPELRAKLIGFDL